MPTGRCPSLLALLLLLFAFCSAQEATAGNILFRLLCYNHSSSLTLRGQPCDSSSECDPEMQFCLSMVGSSDCSLGSVRFAFSDAARLGACSPKTGAKNLPDPVLNIPMTTADLSLRVIIEEVDKTSFFERKTLIDDLKLSVRAADLPSVSDGRKVESKKFMQLSVISRANSQPGQPNIQMGAVVQCAPGHFGALCRVQCNANEKYDCERDGSRRCRLGWAGPICEERDFCASKPCKEWATCHSLPTGFECACDGRTGPQCNRDADPCLNNRCANSAPCMGVQGRPLCLCPPGLKGARCTERDLCRPNPCEPGRCLQTATGATCDCPYGRAGRFCELPVLMAPKATAAAPVAIMKAEAEVGELNKEGKAEFPMVLVMIGAGVGVVLIAGVLLALVCALRKRKPPSKVERKGPKPRFERSCLIRMQDPHPQPMNPYNDAENIYEEPEAVYSTAERAARPIPVPVEGDWPRRQVFVRQSSRC